MCLTASYAFTQPENIVLKDTETKTLKIIDFGTAQDLSNNKQVSMMAGTPEFVGERQSLNLLCSVVLKINFPNDLASYHVTASLMNMYYLSTQRLK